MPVPETEGLHSVSDFARWSQSEGDVVDFTQFGRFIRGWVKVAIDFSVWERRGEGQRRREIASGALQALVEKALAAVGKESSGAAAVWKHGALD